MSPLVFLLALAVQAQCYPRPQEGDGLDLPLPTIENVVDEKLPFSESAQEVNDGLSDDSVVVPMDDGTIPVAIQKDEAEEETVSIEPEAHMESASESIGIATQQRFGYDKEGESIIKSDVDGTLVHKHIYVHVAPEDEEDEVEVQRQIKLPKQKHYKIIFIKAPNPQPRIPLAALQPQHEEKTLVYVLLKKPEQQADIVIPSVPPTPPSKPEVYFIKYKGKDTPVTTGHHASHGIEIPKGGLEAEGSSYTGEGLISADSSAAPIYGAEVSNNAKRSYRVQSQRKTRGYLPLHQGRGFQ